jgi:hypothetical protein
MIRRALLALALVALLAGCLNPATVPPPNPGVTGNWTEPAYDVPFYTGDVGAFRTECELSHTLSDDPLVWPGQPGKSHPHNFWGNTSANASMTNPRVGTGSTCLGGDLNRTAYWAPAMVDGSTQTEDHTFDMVQPATGPWTMSLQVYYKSGYAGVESEWVEHFPPGLRMIAGNPTSTGPQEHVLFDCINTGDALSYYNGIRDRRAIPPDCPEGKIIQVRITFPQCWDGVNLDSPDHKSHMAYPLGFAWPVALGCPSSHPVPLTEIIQHFRYRVGPGGSADYGFVTDLYDLEKPRGYSFHADWWNGWDPATINRIVDDCVSNRHDCRMNLVGFSGVALDYP